MEKKERKKKTNPLPLETTHPPTHKEIQTPNETEEEEEEVEVEVV